MGRNCLLPPGAIYTSVGPRIFTLLGQVPLRVRSFAFACVSSCTIESPASGHRCVCWPGAWRCTNRNGTRPGKLPANFICQEGSQEIRNMQRRGRCRGHGQVSVLSRGCDHHGRPGFGVAIRSQERRRSRTLHRLRNLSWQGHPAHHPGQHEACRALHGRGASEGATTTRITLDKHIIKSGLLG